MEYYVLLDIIEITCEVSYRNLRQHIDEYNAIAKMTLLCITENTVFYHHQTTNNKLAYS